MNKKRLTALVLAGVMTLSLAACGKSQTAEDGTWAPKKDITFAVASGAGGGSDLFTREIAAIMADEAGVTESLLISNETDGGGEVVRNRVAMAKNDNNLILAFMSGAVTGMVKNTKLRMENFTPLAILGSDKSLFFKGEHSKFDDFASFIEAAQAGEEIVIGGSKNDDVALKNKLLQELGIDEHANIEYIIYDSTSDALVALLGGHIELCISKPAASMEYVKAGNITPVLAASTERFGEPFDQAPTLSELGDFNDIEMPLWRSVVGPGDMDEAAAQYYIDALKIVAESEDWKAYCDENLLVPMALFGDEAGEYMMAYQDTVIAAVGEK